MDDEPTAACLSRSLAVEGGQEVWSSRPARIATTAPRLTTSPAVALAAEGHRRSITRSRRGGSASSTNPSGMAGWSQMVRLPSGSFCVCRQVVVEDSRRCSFAQTAACRWAHNRVGHRERHGI